jgi:excisionase family DNA binding protein
VKKRILRTVLYEIVINTDETEGLHVLNLHWQGGVHTELRVRRNTTGQRRVTTPQNAIELIRELSKVCSDQTIAATLNRLGYRTGAGKTWRVHSVHTTRYYYRLPNYRHDKSYVTIEQAAAELGVSETVIRRLIREKILPAAQVVESTPWIIDRQDLALPAVQSAVTALRHGRQLVRVNPEQGELPLV